MRHDVRELQVFPKYGANIISIDFIKRQNPESLSVMEIKNITDFQITEKKIGRASCRERVLMPV